MAFSCCVRKFLWQNRVPLHLWSRNSSSLNPKKIGNREIVGYGINSDCGYVDNPAFPFPAVRFQELDKEFLALREKEKGDWRKLSTQDKKRLYRYSFCQTFAEMNAPSGDWKSIIGKGLFWSSVGIWLFILMKVLLVVPLPPTFCEEHKQEELKRMIALEVNPILGLSSKWDYEENTWKK